MTYVGAARGSVTSPEENWSRFSFESDVVTPNRASSADSAKNETCGYCWNIAA
jgi:hypothetical protein